MEWRRGGEQDHQTLVQTLITSHDESADCGGKLGAHLRAIPTSTSDRADVRCCSAEYRGPLPPLLLIFLLPPRRAVNQRFPVRRKSYVSCSIHVHKKLSSRISVSRKFLSPDFQFPIDTVPSFLAFSLHVCRDARVSNYRAIVAQPTSRGNGRTGKPLPSFITDPLCHARCLLSNSRDQHLRYRSSLTRERRKKKMDEFFFHSLSLLFINRLYYPLCHARCLLSNSRDQHLRYRSSLTRERRKKKWTNFFSFSLPSFYKPCLFFFSKQSSNPSVGRQEGKRRRGLISSFERDRLNRFPIFFDIEGGTVYPPISTARMGYISIPPRSQEQ